MATEKHIAGSPVFPGLIPEDAPLGRQPDSSPTALSNAAALPMGIVGAIRAGVPPTRSAADRMIGNDPAMKAIFQQISEVAPYDYPVHLSGPTGTGKELAARAIHLLSRRRQGAFVPVNCGAIPAELVESELFGHVKGAFSGAVCSRRGHFERAGGGTLFLDEVADLPAHIQVRLLRVLQNGWVEKVGAEHPIRVDVRVISATNRPLKREMMAGRFRQDLYYRINVVPIQLPPLKDRRSDIGLLARHFLERAGIRYGRRPMILSAAALAALERYPWPGNVRELQNAVHFAFVRSHGRLIDVGHLPPTIRKAGGGTSCRLDGARVAAALDRCGGNKSMAARDLGVGRATLYRFLNACPGVVSR